MQNTKRTRQTPRTRVDRRHGVVSVRQPRPVARRQGTRAGAIAAAKREG